MFRQFLPFGVLVSAVLVVIAVIHGMWPNRIDTPAIVLLLLSILAPWLQLVPSSITSIKTPIIEIGLQASKPATDEPAPQMSKTNPASIKSAERQLPPSAKSKHYATDEEESTRLAKRLERIRKAQDSRVVAAMHEMSVIARSMPIATVSLYLQDQQSERRLLAYVRLCMTPDPTLLPNLAECLKTIEHDEFGQSWCIEAIDRSVREHPEAATARTLKLLTECLPNLPNGTARHDQLCRTIHYLEGRLKSDLG